MPPARNAERSTLERRVQYRGYTKSRSRDICFKLGVPNAGASATAQTKEAAFDYLWTPPAWKPKLTVGANYTRRFEKYQIRFQPNVTYLLNELDPI